MISKYFLILLAGLCFSNAYGQVDVQLGQGRLEIVDKQWPLNDSIKKELELRLMARSELLDLVSADEKLLIALPEDYLQPLQDQIETQLSKIENQLMSKIITSIEKEEYSKIESDNEIHGLVLDAKEDSRRVVMGSHQVISADESLQELVVIGGKVDIHGFVNSLVIIGGFVVLHPQSQIGEELVIVGGHVEEKAGAKISGKRVDMSMPGGEEAWTILRDKIKLNLFKEMKDHSWIRFFGFGLKLGVLMLFLWLGEFMAPSYQREVEKYLKQSPGWSAFWGYLSVLLVLPFTLFLTLSLIGIPLLPLQFSLLFIFAIYGEIHIAKYLVSLVPFFRSRLKLATLLGLISIEAIGLLAGLQLLKWAIILVGFGAASKVFYQRVLHPS